MSFASRRLALALLALLRFILTAVVNDTLVASAFLAVAFSVSFAHFSNNYSLYFHKVVLLALLSTSLDGLDIDLF